MASRSGVSSPGEASAVLPFDAVLVANRGEIAVRLIRGVHALGLRAVAVYTQADAAARHVREADVAVSLGAEPSAYTNIPALVVAAKEQNCGAVLPGYGFISENPEAAAAFEAAGVAWAGPAEETVRIFGGKISARAAARKAKVPTVPGSPLVESPDAAKEAVRKVGTPALLKASAGGGGMGQVIVRSEADVPRAYATVVAQADSLFSDTDVYVERYVARARHIEVQIFGNGKGKVVALGERDCSVQRRRQKVIEEGPAPNLPEGTRKALRDAAVTLCATHRYRSAGTVEFILDADSGDWYFLEVNTRLQVEHGVTELSSHVDIVRWMIQLAGGVDVLRTSDSVVAERGYALESRVYAENPVKDYAPCPGRLSEMIWPAEGTDPSTGSITRVDPWAERGTVVSPYYDPLLGKVLTWGRTRDLAIAAMRKALAATVVRGVPTNVELLLQVTENPNFAKGVYTTGLLTSFAPNSTNVEVVDPGLQSSLQDYPGRVGYWDVGVSPSGAMDSYAMCMGNALVGNPIGACALEITVKGPTLKFHASALVALTGACLQSELDDGKPVPWWTPFLVEAGSVLTIGGTGDRKQIDTRKDATVENRQDGMAKRLGGKIAYLSVRGGFDAPKYLGSASTFPTGNFGGIHGGFLKAGDFLPMIPDALDKSKSSAVDLSAGWPLMKSLPNWLIPRYDCDEVIVGAINGPHGSEDFLLEDSLGAIWTSPYKVHHAANRLGIRLIGPTPKWTRKDGGSAGLHPSNLHDYTYAPGAVNFSGNTPIVLAVDGPSLGGFVCPITVSTMEMWKVSQATPGSIIRFKQIPYDASRSAVTCSRTAWDAVRVCDVDCLKELAERWSPDWVSSTDSVDLPAIAAQLDPALGDKAEIKVVYRMSGDEHVLIEYGEIELDLAYRMRVHMLMEELKPREYVKELCPGVRSLLVGYDPDLIHVSELLQTLKQLELGVMGSVEEVVVPSRIIRLPLAFDDQWTKEAQQRYLRSVRPDAPYMPSNVEFVRRINGLQAVEDVKNIMTSCQYCVMGLGDVYLGAPCAVPIDPRHRLVTSKYNPARTYTPEGAVGIGGAYMCIYGMDSPGGYQLCGRTLPIWDNYGHIPLENRGSPSDIPWLLRFFDRVCYFPVTDAELETMRAQYRRGDLKIDFKEDSFSFKDYLAFCRENAQSIAEFKTKQESAFAQERARWEASGEGESNAAAEHASRGTPSNAKARNVLESTTDGARERPPFSVSVPAGVSANVWSVGVADSDQVEQGQPIVTLESMKVEITIEAPVKGVVRDVQVSKGDSVAADTELCLIESSRENAMTNISIEQLRSIFKLGLVAPEMLIESVLANNEHDSVFVSRPGAESCIARVKSLRNLRESTHLPLFGVPFTVSDDIDVAGMKTSAGCAAYGHTAKTSAAVVEALEAAGAILVGKTNMDQFNAGVTGVESSYGIPENPSSPGSVSGGASGAGIAVARRLATFAICVDSCGSAMTTPSLVGEGVIGLKTTSGLLPLTGVAPACPGSDAISIYARSAFDLNAVLKVLAEARNSDKSVCKLPESHKAYSSGTAGICNFTVGVPGAEHVVFTGEDSERSSAQYHAALQTLSQAGGNLEEVDYGPFASVSEAYDSAVLDASRHACLAGLLQSAQVRASLVGSVRGTVGRGASVSASQLSLGLEAVRRAARAAEHAVWTTVDVVAVPCAAETPSVSAAQADPAAAAAALARYARFIAPLDLCALTLPDVLLVAPSMHEKTLVEIAAKCGM